MNSSYNCPRCSNNLSQDRANATSIICECGWTGSKAQLEGRKKSPYGKKIMYIISGLIIGFLVFDGQKWGSAYPEKVMYSILSTLRMTGPVDDARFAKVCAKLKKHHLAVKAYSRAFQKSPKNYSYAGALAKELVKTKKFEQATMTYQNFFTLTEGTANDKRFYAKALAGAKYNDDATEWYYQALRQQPNHLKVAQELMIHLTENQNPMEALSVLGHYNTTFPKTRKIWRKLAADIKTKYNDHISQFEMNEFRISGLSKYLYAPVQFANNPETQIFLVDQESEYLTIDAKFLDSRSIEFKETGAKNLTASSGTSVSGRGILLPELSVGPFQLKNVRAVACDNCAFLLGKKILKRLNFTAENNKGIKYIKLKK